MKKSIIILSATFYSVFAFSQSSKGDWTLSANLSELGWGGSAGFTAGLGIRSDYMLTNNLSVGVQSSYSGNFTSVNTSKLGVFSRYYFGKSAFIGMGLSQLSTIQTIRDMEFKTQGTEYTFEVGKRFPVSKRLYIEPSINYNWGLGKIRGSNRSGFNIGLGVKF